jgi:tetratricopeptide (TPR) repeat protein/transcriptional regulator with XRE-family HTH domain
MMSAEIRGNSTFGESVHAYRTLHCLTQEELGDRAGLSVRSIRKIEKNAVARPRQHTVRLLADAFGLTGAERGRFLRSAVPGPLTQAADTRSVPAQLPAEVREFTGRIGELARLDTLLTRQPSSMSASEKTPGSATVAIAVVSGTAGVGKTALAVAWAHRARDRFPDGQLYVNLRGYDLDQPVTAADPLNGFLTTLGVPSQHIPHEVADRASRYRTELAGRRMLIVLDNASSVEQVRPLLPGTPECAVLVTSRDSLPGLVARDGAERIDLDLLPDEDAHNLLRRLIGHRADTDPATVTVLAERCARLPLALRVAAELAAARPDIPLGDLAIELADQQRRLDLLDAGGDPRAGVSAVFSWSVRNLPASSAQVFPLTGLHPGPTFGRRTIAAMADISPESASTAITVLVRAHLVQPVGPDRYTMHDLLRAYASQLAADHTDAALNEQTPTKDHGRAGTRADVMGRLLDHYLHTAFAADRWLNSHRRPITLTPARPGAAALTIEDYAGAISWFRAEADNLAAAAQFALDNGWYVHAWQLPWTTVNYFYLHGRWSEWISLHLAALEATRRLGDPYAEARTLHALARGYNEFGHSGDAVTSYREALELYRAAGDVNGQANSLNGLSGSCLRLGRLDDALTYATEAIDHYVGLADLTGQASTLNLLGRLHIALGNRRMAVNCHRRALALFRSTKDTYGQANTWDALGNTLTKMGRTAQAAACHSRSVKLHEALGNRFSLAVTHRRLAASLDMLGNHGAAGTHLDRALAIFDELDHPCPEVMSPHLELRQ